MIYFACTRGRGVFLYAQKNDESSWIPNRTTIFFTCTRQKLMILCPVSINERKNDPTLIAVYTSSLRIILRTHHRGRVATKVGWKRESNTFYFLNYRVFVARAWYIIVLPHGSEIPKHPKKKARMKRVETRKKIQNRRGKSKKNARKIAENRGKNA